MKEDIRYCISLNNEHKGMFREKNTSPIADIPVLHHPWLRCVCAQGDMCVKTQPHVDAHVDTRIEHSASLGCPQGHTCEHSASRGCPRGHAREHSASRGCPQGHAREHSTSHGCPQGHADEHSAVMWVPTWTRMSTLTGNSCQDTRCFAGL